MPIKKEERADPPGVTGEDFAQRLHLTRLRAKGEQESETVLRFGKHKGKEYEVVWETDPGYCSWCVTHLSPTSGPSQSSWLQFLVEKSESGAQRSGVTSSGDVVKADSTLVDQVKSLEDAVENLDNRLSWLEAANKFEELDGKIEKLETQ
eukprot:1152834-Pyramimonas_sp.AAC.1